jgi:hypothetical protein
MSSYQSNTHQPVGNNLPDISPLYQQKKMMSTIVGKDVIPKNLNLRYLSSTEDSYQPKSYAGFNLPIQYNKPEEQPLN